VSGKGGAAQAAPFSCAAGFYNCRSFVM